MHHTLKYKSQRSLNLSDTTLTDPRRRYTQNTIGGTQALKTVWLFSDSSLTASGEWPGGGRQETIRAPVKGQPFHPSYSIEIKTSYFPIQELRIIDELLSGLF